MNDADAMCLPCREGDHEDCDAIFCMCIDMEHDEDES